MQKKVLGMTLNATLIALSGCPVSVLPIPDTLPPLFFEKRRGVDLSG